MTTQPVWGANTIVAIVAAVVGLLVAFGFDISEDQKIAILTLVAVISPFIAAAWSNPRVTPLAKPEDEDGTPLVRSVDGQITNTQMRSMLKKD